MLTWDQSERVIGLRNTYKMYEGDVFHKSLHPLTFQHHNTALPNITYISKGHQRTISGYLKNQDVTGLLIGMATKIKTLFIRSVYFEIPLAFNNPNLNVVEYN